MASLTDAINYARKNPKSDFARQLKSRIQSGEADADAQKEGVDLSVFGRVVPVVESVEPPQKDLADLAADQYKGSAEKIISSVSEGAGKIEKGDIIGGVTQAGLGSAAGAVQGIFAPLTAVLQRVMPKRQEGADAAIESAREEGFIGKESEQERLAADNLRSWAEAHPDAARNLMDLATVGTAGLGGTSGILGKTAATMTAKEGVQAAKSVVTDIAQGAKNVVSKTVDPALYKQGISKLKGVANESVEKSIANDVDGMLTATRGISKKVQDAEARGADLKTTLSDPAVFKGIKVEKGKILPDDAIAVVDDRIDKLMEAKKEMLPAIDKLVPATPREVLRQRAIEAIKGKYLEGDEQGLIEAINKQVDALPEELLPSQIDAIRAKARASARNAKGQMKSQSEYAALETAARDTIFDITDNLPVSGAQDYKALNDYVKNMITTREFLDETLRNQVVQGGRMRGYAMKVIGSVAGSTHGILGAIAGAEAGGLIADIITNNQLGSSIKMRLIKNITDDPSIIKQAEDLLGEIKDLDVPQLPKPSSDFRTQTTGGKPLELPSRTPSSVEASERANPNIKVPKGEGGGPQTPSAQKADTSDPFDGFTRQPNLSATDRIIETAAGEKYATKKDALVTEYIQQFGTKVANADLARRLFRDVGYNGRNSAAVHEAASALNKDIWKKALKNPEPDAILYAGGSGSGKSTAVQGVLPEIENHAAAILDGNLSKLESAKTRIKEAIAAGKKPVIVYVYRDPVDAWVNGVIKRMRTNKEEGGRVVPLSTFLENAPNSLEVARTLKNAGIEVTAVDNSLGAGNARVMSDTKLNTLSYPKDLRAILERKTKELLDAGQITKDQYDALTS